MALEILNTNTSVQASQIINGNTVNYVWSFNNKDKPNTVSFSVVRGIANDPSYTGNVVITGSYLADSKSFDVQNRNIQHDDFLIYGEILLQVEQIAITESAKTQSK